MKSKFNRLVESIVSGKSVRINESTDLYNTVYNFLSDMVEVCQADGDYVKESQEALEAFKQLNRKFGLDSDGKVKYFDVPSLKESVDGEPRTWLVQVRRVEKQDNEFKVEAANEEEAKKKGLEAADYDWEDINADVNMVVTGVEIVD